MDNKDYENMIKDEFRKLFPLVDERDLPWYPTHIAEFLKKRIAFEVEQQVFWFQSRVVKVLCEVSPPKTYVEDMARIVVDKAKKADELEARIRKIENGQK